MVIVLVVHSLLLVDYGSANLCSDDPSAGLCNVCNCECNITVRCGSGPPVSTTSSPLIDIILESTTTDNIEYLTLSFTNNLVVTDPVNNEDWSSLDLRGGKYNIATKDCKA